MPSLRTVVSVARRRLVVCRQEQRRSPCVSQAIDGGIEQENLTTGVKRPIRLVPFFFEFEAKAKVWQPVTEVREPLASGDVIELNRASML